MPPSFRSTHAAFVHPHQGAERLEVEGVGKRFGRKVLFRGITFSLNGGDCLAITGANGTGKSTLLQVLAGLQTPSRGAVRLMQGATAVPPEAHPHHCGFLGPYLQLYDGLTAREVLRFLARARALSTPDAHIERLLLQVQLQGAADRAVRYFSSGMKQRLRLATALLAQPRILLLDEPGTTLDEAGKALMAETQAAHLEHGGIVVVATNDPSEAARCARTLCVEDYVGSPADRSPG